MYTFTTALEWIPSVCISSIKKKKKRARIISITSYEYISIGFRRMDLGFLLKAAKNARRILSSRRNCCRSLLASDKGT